MNRFTWTLAALLIAAGLVSVRVNRNSNKELMPYLGKWLGGFTVQSLEGRSLAASELERWNTEGYLQLYATRRRFKMSLQGEQQEIVVQGTWAIERPGRLRLVPAEVTIEDAGGFERRDPNLPYLENQDVRAAYAKPLFLDLSRDGKSLQGLLTSIGPLTGAHRFQKV